MRRNRLTVSILAVPLVVLVTTAPLLTAAMATYLTVRDDRRRGIPADFLTSLYRPAGAALVVGALLSAALCALLWRLRDTIQHMARQLRDEFAARQKSESMFSTVLDAVPYLIWWKDTQGVYLGCNQPFVEAGGLHEAKDILGKTDFDLPWPRTDAEAYQADDQQVLAANRAKRHIVEPIKHAGGSRRWADTTKVPLLDANGIPYGVLGVAEDITERKEAEDALRREKALTEAIFDNVPGIIHLYDDLDRLVRWNARATQISGFSDADLMLRPAGTGRTGKDRSLLLDAMRRVKRDGRATVETYLLTKDGNGIPVLVIGVRVILDGRPHVLAIAIDISERKRAEEALRREKAVTDALFDNVPALLALYDDAGRLIRWNRETNEITGFSDAESATQHVGDRQPPEERERIISSVREVMQRGHGIGQEATLLTKGGGRIPFYFKGVRVMLDGKPHLLSIGVDITERKHAEEALMREKTLTDAIFASMPGILYVNDDNGRLVRWNGKLSELTGLSNEEMPHLHIGDNQPEEDRERVAIAARKVMEEGQGVVEANLQTTRGPVPYYFTGVRVVIDGKPHLIGVGIDISERKRAEEALRREKAVTDALFDNVPALLAIYDDDGRLIRWNRKTNEITGFSDAELAPRAIGDHQPPEERERIIASVQRVMREGHEIVQEATLVTKRGDRIPYHFTGVRVMLDGKPHLLSIGVDITERKLAEEQLRHALERAESANQAKDRFLAAVSHELRTPLAPVLFLSSSLESDARLPADARRDLTDIREHAEIEKRLIADLLDFSAIHAGKLQIHPVRTDVHDVLRAAIRTCQSGIDRKRLRLDLRLDARHHQVNADADRLRQVFWNLLQNACKFTPERHTIFVRTCDDDGHTLRVEIADSGMGMTPDTLRRVFQPFEQGPRDPSDPHIGGLGLGLAISKSLVEAHGGSITATSEGPNRGSTFIVTLPLHVTLSFHAGAQPSGTPRSAAQDSPPPNTQSLRLLLVEDDPTTLKLLGRLLSADGHDVTAATSVDAALRAAAEQPFDLVISDLSLPDGSGLDLMSRLRDQHHLPGIALSGHGSPEDLDVSRRAGFSAHLTKPVTPNTLRSALAQFTSFTSSTAHPA